MAQSLLQNLTSSNPATSQMPVTSFMPILTAGPPTKVPQKRMKCTVNAAQLDVVEQSDPMGDGDIDDSTSLTYWKDYNKETNGQVVERFCYELHEHVINTCCASFSTTQTDPKIQSMETEARTGYLGQPGSIQTGGYADICNYINIYVVLCSSHQPSHLGEKFHSLHQQTLYVTL
jgi:hypothetical protein